MCRAATPGTLASSILSITFASCSSSREIRPAYFASDGGAVLGLSGPPVQLAERASTPRMGGRFWVCLVRRSSSPSARPPQGWGSGSRRLVRRSSSPSARPPQGWGSGSGPVWSAGPARRARVHPKDGGAGLGLSGPPVLVLGPGSVGRRLRVECQCATVARSVGAPGRRWVRGRAGRLAAGRPSRHA